ncbi:4-carboxymuconolactone decarboxylase [Planomonospora venezuelensis]|uniref:3-oxoadipate enol-lactonase/4-carboxymuconolactone decarboxylase n=1 Tax=Planomonospora venezuelensis TaxID=1999 RepID=A0A841CUN9_PLAVE|nr:4-carboxymuconolactone decarboxylase [Planomonospora venezuelensis]MBB5961561.1 3-oxoadipate enol-lactonase/4-carboxymuconolactone decarboxylase [Planomonospora venezuelensis]GIM98707.1 3-oxoadipate enol-lactonase [Planomonospora venezuelensis]
MSSDLPEGPRPPAGPLPDAVPPRLHHRIDGPAGAPLLVLGPSLGTGLEIWDPQMEALTASWRVLRYDLPGHGGSAPARGVPAAGPVRGVPAAGLTLGALAGAVLDLVGEERFAIGGISLGGAIAATVAADVPHRVTHLVMCCSSARFGEPGPWLERAAAVRRDGMEPLARVLPGRWFTSRLTGDDPRVRGVLDMVRAVDPESYAACCEAIAGYDLTPRLGRITAPALVVAGADDPATPVGHALALASGIPGALLSVVPGAAHLANVERAEAVASAIVRHLGGAGGRGEARPGGDEHLAAGTRTRREVLGDAHVDRAAAGTTAFTADFQEFITRYAWDGIWNRPGLDRRTRSCVTLTALVAGGHLEELAMHVRAALRNGLTSDEIKEVLLQTAVYCGVPAANAAFAVARRTLAEHAGTGHAGTEPAG